MSNETKSTKIKFFDIPAEIREIIYSHFKLIRNTKTQISIRNVCKEWHNLINDIKIYDINNKIKFIHIFKKNQFKTLYSNRNLKKLILFEPYSKFKYIEYNENRKLIKIIENFPPYKLIMYEKKGDFIYIKKTNLLNFENSIEVSKKIKCLEAVNPIINYENDYLDHNNDNNNYPHYFLNNNNAPHCVIS